MFKRRQLLQYAGLGGVGVVIGLHHQAFSTPLRDPGPDEIDGDLESFSYEVPQVDAKGRIRHLRHHQGHYFLEDLGLGEYLTMVAISPGNYRMGAGRYESNRQRFETPRHLESITPFFMGRYPVTQAQWAKVAALSMVRIPLDPNPAHFVAPDHPVENVSWYEAVEFCDRLSVQSGRTYRLATEREWEYACRAGTQTPFSTGDTITSDLANYVGTQVYRSEASGNYRGSTVPVGAFPPNAFGLHDLHGNVWEWCSDSWRDSYGASHKRDSGEFRVLRGGSWMDSPAKLRSASRVSHAAGEQSRVIGFRVSCT